MAALAKRLSVTHSTLTNIQSANRSASPELMDKISKLAPGVADSAILGPGASDDLRDAGSEVPLGERLVQDHLQRIQDLQGLEEVLGKNIKDVARNFDAMNKDDVFIYLSATKRPLEMDPDETVLKNSIANALSRQAFFLYLRPTKAYLWSLGDFVDIRAEFNDFKAKVFSRLPAETAISSNQLLLIEADDNPLFVTADFKWELFYSDTINAPYRAAAGALIAAGRGPNFTGPNFRIPLSAGVTKRVLFEIAKTVYFANPTLDQSDQVPLHIVTRLKESAEFATGAKVEELHAD
jgi:hypothetical protein